MKAIDMKNHMMKAGTWVNWDDTVDRFIIGDPETEVKGIAVAWQSRTAALKKAVEMGCNLFVTHEPTFYRHRDNDENVFKQPHAEEKRKLIEDNGLVIFRCHDVWDQMPKIGIVDSWGEHLGFTEKVASGKFHNVYKSPKSTLKELAKLVAGATSYLNQPYVEMVGKPDKKVAKVAVGCGAITEYYLMKQSGADVIIATDDGMRYWYSGAWAVESGMPLIVVNHATAEEPGLKKLAAYIGEQFPEIKTKFIAQGCMYKVVI
ncbi:MAG: Nif3-like dinuclear metal center hexameric protein [Armatimonadota bacterium]|nr:Nif3-like dinuclear metal center hexameric protein [Armatimonadota bacterium]